MRVITYPKSKFQDILSELTKRNDLYFLEFVQVSSVITRFGAEFLTLSELATLNFLVGRTLAFRKKAELISREHFTKGVESSTGTRICSGVGVANSTLRIALEGLAEKGIISIHAFLDGKVETIPRVYEVNSAKILEGRDTEEVLKVLARTRNLGAKSGENTGAEDRHTPCRNPADLKEVLRTSNTSSYEEVPAASQPAPQKSFLRDRKRPKAGAIDCTSPTVTAKERAQQILGAAREKRTVRASNTKVPTKRWTVPVLQALLDKAREAAGISIGRVVVTTKPISILHKRMAEAKVSDALDFFTWALRNWNVVANANRKAKARQMKVTKAVQSEMSLTPNFNDLAYRFPYILAFYNDRVYVKEQEATVKKEKEATQRVEREQRESAAARRREHARRMDEKRAEELRRQDAEFDAKRRQQRKRTPQQQDTDDDWEMPEFKAREWGEK